MRNRRSTCSRAFPARFGPSSGFGYPLDGFLPSSPCRLYFAPAALLGFALRSLTSRKVSACHQTDAPTYRWPSRQTTREADDRTRSAAVSGLRPFRGLRVRQRVFSTSADRKLPWACPFQGLWVKTLIGCWPNLLSHAWPGSGEPEFQSASQSFHRPSPCLTLGMQTYR